LFSLKNRDIKSPKILNRGKKRGKLGKNREEMGKVTHVIFSNEKVKSTSRIEGPNTSEN
jgi:hypothetical protein